MPTSYYGSSPLCVCGHPCDVRTAGDQSKNPGREFYVCPKVSAQNALSLARSPR